MARMCKRTIDVAGRVLLPAYRTAPACDATFLAHFRNWRSGVIALPILAGFINLSLMTPKPSQFAEVLESQHRSPGIPASAASVYDWLIGDWEVDVYDYENGEKITSKGEWHFSWVL